MHVDEAHFPQLVGDERQDAFPVGLGGKAPVPIVFAELLQFVVQCLASSPRLVRFPSLLPVSIGLVSVSVRLTTPERGEIFEGRGRHHSRFVPLFCCLPPRHAVLGVEGAPGGESFPRLEPLTQGSWVRRCGASLTTRDARMNGRAALRGLRETMGQGAHHLGPSLAPAPHNSLLGRRIGASSLPAPPLVTTRVGPGDLAQGRRADRVGSTRLRHTIGGRTSHGTRERSHRRTLTGSPKSRLDTVRRNAWCDCARTYDAAAMHNLPQRIFRLTSGPRGPAGFQRQDGIGRRWLGKGRRVRRVIPAGVANVLQQIKRAPPVMDGMVRTVAWGDRRCIPENQYLYLRVFRGPGHGGRLRPGLNVVDRHELPFEAPCLNVSNWPL